VGGYLGFPGLIKQLFLVEGSSKKEKRKFSKKILREGTCEKIFYKKKKIYRETMSIKDVTT